MKIIINLIFVHIRKKIEKIFRGREKKEKFEYITTKRERERD
jgi:hypothetical protein